MTHGVSMSKLGYDLMTLLPTPPHTDMVVKVHACSKADQHHPPVMSVRTTHSCVIKMEVVGQGVREGAARTFDTSSAFLEMMIEDKPFEVQARLQSMVESERGGGVESVEARRETWAQRVFNLSFDQLSSEQQCIIMTALEGALKYPCTEEEWKSMRPALERLFAGTPTIVEVVRGPFDQSKAGKNIRQSDRGT